MMMMMMMVMTMMGSRIRTADEVWTKGLHGWPSDGLSACDSSVRDLLRSVLSSGGTHGFLPLEASPNDIFTRPYDDVSIVRKVVVTGLHYY
jgi:hypothetical protein